MPQETAILRYITLNYTRNLYLGADISQISQSFSWIHWAASVLHRYATMATMVTMATMATVVTMATVATMIANCYHGYRGYYGYHGYRSNCGDYGDIMVTVTN